MFSQNPYLNPKTIMPCLDNARIHKTIKYFEKFSQYFNFLFNVPYSCQMNPIEYFFGNMKHTVRKMRPKGENGLIRTLKKFINEFNSEELAPFMLAAARFYEKALLGEDF